MGARARAGRDVDSMMPGGLSGGEPVDPLVASIGGVGLGWRGLLGVAGPPRPLPASCGAPWPSGLKPDHLNFCPPPKVLAGV
mmetsp:Transcript_110745/g.238331  ORF Transcript_110745/g.238331 Transcript_110745/m.238331 type:complete len:82 (+) Transcript_110745:381-626(+)